jgi:P-type conjugative transfer protein TrbG
MTRPLLLSACIATLSLASPALAQPSPKDAAAISASNEAATRGPSDASLVGALHEFAYERGALYAVQASPQRITDIALEPGETLLSVSAGDTTRWIVGDAQSGIAGSMQSHILVKPNAANLATNLVIMTDRRVYHIDLRSTSGAAMASVAWRYPVEMTLTTSAPPPPPPPAAAAAAATPVFTPETLNLRYRIDGDKPDWRPLSAFDDGKQVYIEMPDNLIEAPPLSVIGDEGLEAVNYRIRGKYYIVDRLFKKAELRLGSGWSQKRVTIIRQTPIAAVNTNGGPNG